MLALSIPHGLVSICSVCHLNRPPWAASFLSSVRCVTAEARSSLQGWWPLVMPMASCILEVPSSWRCSRPKDQTKERVGNKQGNPWLDPPPGERVFVKQSVFPKTCSFCPGRWRTWRCVLSADRTKSMSPSWWQLWENRVHQRHFFC